VYDAIIVGAGPAGLSAALILGRCRRRVVVFDTEQPRNAASQALHGFLTRDGIHPRELRRIGREQLARYPSVELRLQEVVDARRLEQGFELTLADGTREVGRYLILATGVVDELPPLEGLEPLWGTSVFHCPYCDGWEQRERRIAVYGRGRLGSAYALEMLGWSSDLVLCTDGDRSLGETYRAQLGRHGVIVQEKSIAGLEAEAGRLARVRFQDGDSLERDALFFSPLQHQRSPLPERLGCRMHGGLVDTDRAQGTNVPGLFVAGDAVRSRQMAIIAAAEGARAAVAVNTALLEAEHR